MEKQKNKRKLFKRIGVIVGAVVVAIVAFSLPFLGKFNLNFNSKNMVASADSVDTNYTFNASDTYYLGAFDFNGNAIGSRFLLFSANISYVDGNLSTLVDTRVADSRGTSIVYSYAERVTLIDKNYSVIVDGDRYSTFPLSYNMPYRVGFSILSEDNDIFEFVSYIYASDGFNANVYKIDLGLSTTNEWQTEPREDGLIFMDIIYYDINDNYLKYSFVVSPGFEYNSRTYYISNPSQFNDNQMYNSGYSAGYNEGHSDGEDVGYNSGYKSGEIVGYNNGYSAGANAAGEYTFFGLISAIIDAPIQAFMGLFNFELLGINLAGFFTGLLTVAFIITIVRMIL